MCVTIRRLHLDQALADLQDRHVKRAATQVEDQDRLILGLVESIRQGRRGRLIDDAHDLEPCDLPGVLGRLTLAVVKIGRYGNHRLRHRLPKIGLGILLQLLKDHRRDLLRRIALILDGHPYAGIVLRARDDVIGDHLARHLDLGLIRATPHQPLDRVHCVLGVDDGLALRRVTHQPVAALGERHHRREQTSPLGGGDHGRLPTLHHRNDGVRRPQVNTYDFRHALPPSLIIPVPV